MGVSAGKVGCETFRIDGSRPFHHHGKTAPAKVRIAAFVPILTGMKLLIRSRRVLPWFCLLFVSLAQTAAADERPNVLMIAIDDLNDWVGCLAGHPQAQTPNIDRLAARGTLFDNAHCQAPLCNPSRTSLMTGLRPSTTGIYGLAPWFRDVESLSEQVTLPQHFAAAGYRTLTAGKIYHYGGGNLNEEFHERGPWITLGALPEKRPLVETPANHPLVDWGEFPHRDEDKGDWKISTWTEARLQEEMPEPFFMSVGFFLPHVPCYATKQWFELYPANRLQLPPVLMTDRDDTPRFSWYLHWKLPEPRLKFLQEADEWNNLVRSYLACISFVDSLVGRVLDALDESGHADNTIVVLWSDHGFHLGEKLITGKNTLWERSTRVPFMFAGPSIEAGARCGRPAELLDIYPTLSELCQLGPDANVGDKPNRHPIEGHSLVPQLVDAEAPRAWPAITTHNHDNHGVRSERWRYIQYADGSQELYNTDADPNEWSNLADDAKYADVIAEHQGWLPKKNAPPAPGSAARVLTYRDGQANWEKQDIAEDDPIPEL